MNILDVASTTNILDCAATGGHMKIPQWLHDKHPHSCSPSVMDFATKNGHLVILKSSHTPNRGLYDRSVGCGELV